MSDSGSHPTPRGKVKLTPLGELAVRHGAMTTPNWWRSMYREANRVADRDGEWELFFDEKIAGLREMRDRFYELQSA